MNHRIKKCVDICMVIVLLFLMAYQVTGDKTHEWVGIAETALVMVHQILNRKWYSALFKGKYNPYRIVVTLNNVLLLAVFFGTAFCGMSMSGHAVPFLYGLTPVYLARQWHLALSHWAFVLMGLHLGLHLYVMLPKKALSGKTGTLLNVISCAAAGYGFFLFLRNNMADYMFFKVVFAFLDYGKSPLLVLLENLLMLVFWVFAGLQISNLIRGIPQRTRSGRGGFILPIVMAVAAVLIGLAINAAAEGRVGFLTGNSNQNPVVELPTDEPDEPDEPEPVSVAAADVQDGFVLIAGGTFLMGSPDTENWRVDDETAHEASVSGFYMDPYETTQKEYERLTGTNPSTFVGEELPVDNISWLDAVLYANAKSIDAGLEPAYQISEDGIRWDRGANGYRLPTEAEWEYACRAGTTTPFNTETSISTEEANYWGSYPYEIEENYFNTSVLETKPGSSKRTTVAVGSYPANGFGLYDAHGNVNEWCWDYYGTYVEASDADYAGPAEGTRHIYRGGGWNDFAKNLRSAYRAAGQSDLKSYNLGVRLVRNADNSLTDVITVSENTSPEQIDGKVLIAYYSWGGNTRGIAKEIQRQTGADIFEITLVNPYSENYNTVLMEAQEAQHRQDRPEIENHIDNFDAYDVILLGYPNWWASIPMPIATFLEEYNFAGKRVIPFCSHGGGRFGQSLTAIAKLVPDADMGEGLAINYSGGVSMPNDVSAWLDANGITRE